MSLSQLKKAQKEAQMAAAAAAVTNAESVGDTAPQADTALPVMAHDFFKIKKDNDGNYKDVNLVQIGFIRLLLRLGFRRYDKNDGSFCIVKMQENILEEISIQNLRLLVLRHIQSMPVTADGRVIDPETERPTILPHEHLVEKYVRSMATLLSEEKLSLLLEDGQQFNLLKDNQTTAYFFFLNGFVAVSAQGIKLHPYTELPGAIWKDQILPREYHPIADAEVEKGQFYRFCSNVSDNRPLPNSSQPATTNHGTNPERFVALMTIAGYQLHNYFQTHLRTTILLDARTSDEPDGRSGKSLFCKALRYIITADQLNSPLTVNIDGKLFDPGNRFRYEQLHHNTRLVVLDDIRRDLTIEEFFNSIVDGFSVERKGATKRERVLCKLIITLNYTMRIRGGSAKDRVIEFEFADYYSAAFKPEHEFGGWFFRDWDDAEWGRFDNFLMWCVNHYFSLGVIEPQTLNLSARKLKDETCQEFVDWMEEMSIEHEKPYCKQELHAKFVGKRDDGTFERKELLFVKSVRQMTAFLKAWCEYRPEIAGYRTFRSNSLDMIQFFYNAPVRPEFQDDRAVFFPHKSDNCKTTDAATGEGEGATLPF